MQFVRPALNDEDAYKRKAALLALAVLAEGCADYIRNRFAAYLSLRNAFLRNAFLRTGKSMILQCDSVLVENIAQLSYQY